MMNYVIIPPMNIDLSLPLNEQFELAKKQMKTIVSYDSSDMFNNALWGIINNTQHNIYVSFYHGGRPSGGYQVRLMCGTYYSNEVSLIRSVVKYNNGTFGAWGNAVEPITRSNGQTIYYSMSGIYSTLSSINAEISEFFSDLSTFTSYQTMADSIPAYESGIPIYYNVQNGTYTGPSIAQQGEEVVATISPFPNFKISKITVYDNAGNIPFIRNGNQIAFTVPT